MADGWDVLGAVGGTVGVIGGLVFGALSWRLGLRSVDAADRAVGAADRSAEEARSMTWIEGRRYHREIGPKDIKVAFRWRPGVPNTVHAHITNNGAHDVDIRVTHHFATGGHENPTTRPLPVGVTETVALGVLDVQGIPETGQGWITEGLWQAYAENPDEVEKLESAFEFWPLKGGKVIIDYATAEPCQCDIDPPSDDYGHWKTTHRINGVTF